MRRLRRLFSGSSLPGWFLLLWRLVGTAGDLDFLANKMQTIIDALNSPWALIAAVLWLTAVAFDLPLHIRSAGARYGLWSATAKMAPPNRDWLVAIADRDRKELPHCLLVNLIQGQCTNLDGPEPFITIHLTIFNGSVFSLRIDRIEGHINFQEQILRQTPEIVSQQTIVGHADNLHIELRQWISEHTAEIMRGIRSSGVVQIDIKDVVLYLVYQDPERQEVELVSTHLGNLVTCN